MCGRVLLRQGNVLRRHLRGQSIPLSRHLDVPASGCQVQPHMCENVVLRNAQASRERPAERQHGPSPALDAARHCVSASACRPACHAVCPAS